MQHDLYLMRHGQTVWNAQGRMQGWLDSPLTELGRRQAEWQAALVADVTGAARYASPLGRAQQTAAIVFGGAEVISDDRLREIDVGDFSGHCYPDLVAAHPHLFGGGRLAWYDRAPGGEGLAALRARAEAFLADLTGPALIVTHGITLRMLRLVALGRPDTLLEDMSVEQGAVHVIRAGQHSVWRHPQSHSAPAMGAAPGAVP